MSYWSPQRAPVSEDRQEDLRWVMGPSVWDCLKAECPPERWAQFLEAYDTAVEVLYGGDVTGAEEAQVTDGGKKADHKWPFRDARALPLKAGADHYLARCAQAIRKGQG